MINDLANRALTAVTRVMGEPLILRHRGQAVIASGVYQNAYVGLDPETGVQVRSTHPVVLINSDDLPFKLQQGDEVEARGTVFKVRDAQSDGHSGVLVMLHRTSNR